jgi:ketosteroid isomerase-like protein
VETTIRRYWKITTSKEVIAQQNSYADNASVFATDSRRLEPARLVLLRRQREYLSTATRMIVEVGEIEVELLGTNHALAAYTIRLDAEQIARMSVSGQKISEEHLENARVTHVVHRQLDGVLRIVHEHISVPQA